MLTESRPGLLIDLLARFEEGRKETDRLFGMLSSDVFYERPIPERHRIVFYIGHLETFDWNLLRTQLGLVPFHPKFDQLFAFGIDPVDGGLPSDQSSDWPIITEVENYRHEIRRRLDGALAKATENADLAVLMNIAIEHRLMHAETLEYMLHQLPYPSKRRQFSQPPAEVFSYIPEMVHIPFGRATLGLERQLDQFGWDNEFEAHTVAVPAFSIDKHKVTNAQFLKFFADDGYTRRALWSAADWEWKMAADISHPAFWVPAGTDFRYRGMFEETRMPMDAPVYVSHAEACAYACWSGKKLPSEAEWQRAAVGAKAPADSRTLWDPPSVGSFPEAKSDFGVEGLFGTGWEWTSTPFGPFPGFQIFAAYPGYSANFFDGKHFVMKGGSTRTAACMLRRSFRNWFQAHYQYVYAGFRCVTH